MTYVHFRSAVVVLHALLAALTGEGVHASNDDDVSMDPARRCRALERSDFSAIVDAPTQVISARATRVDKADTAHCEVQAYVAPAVGLTLVLPLHDWNQKLLHIGCGGHCGSTAHVVGCNRALARGYACVVTDGGHKSSAMQALWAYNNWQAQIDYFVRANHVTTLAAKAIISAYYGEAPRHAYFSGCSAGGREGMILAQRFPWDYDGIIAGCPSLSQITLRLNSLWAQRALTDIDGTPVLSTADLKLLHEAVISQCDIADGLKDGLLENPLSCHFDAATLQCRASKRDGCLTSQQIEAVKKVYRGATTSDGKQITPPGAVMGSEKTWMGWFIGAKDSGMSDFIQEAFRYYALVPNPGASWRLENFDFDRDYPRLSLADSLYSATNPDLRRFKAAGGKLLAYTGWNDAAGMPLPVIDYYESVEKLMGGRNSTQDFFRLFVVPGMNHCMGGEGASAIDYLSYLERWVEGGFAPEQLLSYHLRRGEGEGSPVLDTQFPPEPGDVKFSRPVYPYPMKARYRGHGDPTQASSFAAASPE